LRNSARPPNADLAIIAALVSGASSGCAVLVAIAISSRRVPSWTESIRGRAAISSPKNLASISLSAVHPAKCSTPV
jgi:hypothetical protein